MTGGELALAGFVFALIYLSGLLPKIAAFLAGDDSSRDMTAKPKGE